jgi:hypothetical protein
MSSIGWIDFSSEHRERVRTVIDLIRRPGVVDELGIGVIRDAFSDFLFPGISTIQTRAKYFTLTALLLKDYENLSEKKKASQSLEKYLREWEPWCRRKLCERYGDSGDALGIIGVSFGNRKDRDVQRRPSSVYWSGLRTFGLLRTPLSLSEYSRRLADGRKTLRALLDASETEKGDDPDADGGSTALLLTPEVDPEYWNDLSITLTRDEAEFLRHQVTSRVPDSLLGQILLDRSATRQVVSLAKRAAFKDFVDLPFIKNLPDAALRYRTCLALDFWRIMEGAHIRYNCLLQERFGTPRQKENVEEKWNDWKKSMRNVNWRERDSETMWSLVRARGSRVPGYTKAFVDSWIHQAQLPRPDRVECESLVMRQERANKRGRARLRPNNRDEQVNEWIGLSALEYRLPQVKQFVIDIHRGETGKADADAGH